MRRLFLYIFICLIVFGCNQKDPSYSPEFSFLNKEADGLVVIRSSGFGAKEAIAVKEAQKNVFYHILFKGIPGTELNVPMIENESEAKAKHNEYFNKLLDQGRYKDFMLSSVISSTLIKVNGGQQISVDVKINCNSLRKDLEQNQVIRKFGF
jgi:hypothetical protein